MKLREALTLHGRPVDIPDASRDELPALFAELGLKVGAEIGVYKGRFSRQLCEAGLKVYSIDPYQAYGPYTEGAPTDERLLLQERQDYLYRRAARELRPWLKTGQCELVRKSSMEAVEQFPLGSLDFVYIDGNHGFRFIAEDLAEWTFRVRKGGIVAGHDYCHNPKEARDPYTCHVPYALKAWLELIRQPDWYVIGSREKTPGEVRDRFRSWFWVRQ